MQDVCFVVCAVAGLCQFAGLKVFLSKPPVSDKKPRHVYHILHQVLHEPSVQAIIQFLCILLFIPYGVCR